VTARHRIHAHAPTRAELDLGVSSPTTPQARTRLATGFAGCLPVTQRDEYRHRSIGRFLEVDPVEGGSANDYSYGFGDPLNGADLDGLGFLCGSFTSCQRRLQFYIAPYEVKLVDTKVQGGPGGRWLYGNSGTGKAVARFTLTVNMEPPARPNEGYDFGYP
jgi:hypothetical protein